MTDENMANHRSVIIVGSGPAGYTAAIYTARAQLEPLIIAGSAAGGQLMLTTEVENYPGFPTGRMGPELMADFQAQAERFGATILFDDVLNLDLRQRPFTVQTGSETFTADAVIITTGASAKWLEVPGEERLRGRGVSSCATCDGFFFRGLPLVVVGGGDTAMEEALFLTRFASRVTVIHRRDTLRASKTMQQRAFDHPKINFIWDTVVEEVLGDEKVTSLRLKNLKTGEESTLDVAGVFVAIGHQPNTELVAGQIELDAQGYVLPQDPITTATNIEGVFAAGDVRDHRYRQAITAAGDGCRAAIDAERWLAENPHIHVKVDFSGQVYAGMADPPPPEQEQMSTTGN